MVVVMSSSLVLHVHSLLHFLHSSVHLQVAVSDILMTPLNLILSSAYLILASHYVFHPLSKVSVDDLAKTLAPKFFAHLLVHLSLVDFHFSEIFILVTLVDVPGTFVFEVMCFSLMAVMGVVVAHCKIF